MNRILEQIKRGEPAAIARAITLVENELESYEQLLKNLNPTHEAKIVGITGAPGTGKSTLTDALIEKLLTSDKRIAVLCVDPSSPFNFGALLGDRIRMSSWYTHPRVFIRSLATRGSLGGLHPKIVEITDLLKAAAFDYIIIETVGVGQTEVEITGLADTTIVVLVPEGGDEVQTMKAGVMEIADIFVLNKSDRPGAEDFLRNLRLMLAPSFNKSTEVTIVPTVASEKKGVDELVQAINKNSSRTNSEKKSWLRTEKAYQLIRQKRMKDINKEELRKAIDQQNPNFNLYQFVEDFGSINR